MTMAKSHDWVKEVLRDVVKYASLNDLPELEAHLRTASALLEKDLSKKETASAPSTAVD